MVGIASLILQIHLALVEISTPNCFHYLDGGSIEVSRNPSTLTGTVNLFYDNSCNVPYIETSVTGKFKPKGANFQATLQESSHFFAPDGSTALGTLTLTGMATLNSNANLLNLLTAAKFTPVGKAPIPLGLICTPSLTSPSIACAGAIAQNFPPSIALGSLTPITMTLGTHSLTFSGGSSQLRYGKLRTVKLGKSSTKVLVAGGTVYGSTTLTGSAPNLVLFPPAPTTWTITDSAHGAQAVATVVGSPGRNTELIISKIWGAMLASADLDDSGSGILTYSDSSTVPIVSWFINP